MKIIKQLTPAIPLVIIVYLLLRLSLSNEGCYGLVEFFYSILLYLLLFITGIIALIKTFSGKENPQLVTLAILILALLSLFIGKMWGEDFKGSIFLYAENENQKISFTNTLKLRNNGTFVVNIGGVDFSCYYSGKYQKINDTILLDKETVNKTGSVLTTSYHLQEKLLMPIIDTSIDKNNYVAFKIQTK